MYTISLQNKNGRVLREYKGVELPRGRARTADINAALELIWLGMAAACAIGRIVVTDETTGKEIANKMFVAK